MGPGEGLRVLMEAVCNLWNRRWTTELLSRLLVLLTLLLLFAMPITEYFCDWDHFLRGGPDVEFSVLAWLLFAAMLVLTMNGTILRPRWMGASSKRTIPETCRTTPGWATLQVWVVAAVLPESGEADFGCLSSLPLRI
jgi:hypothetical protein